jgi:hypothetical protein
MDVSCTCFWFQILAQVISAAGCLSLLISLFVSPFLHVYLCVAVVVVGSVRELKFAGDISILASSLLSILEVLPGGWLCVLMS